jgi:opacity protein-like surface antigen
VTSALALVLAAALAAPQAAPKPKPAPASPAKPTPKPTPKPAPAPKSAGFAFTLAGGIAALPLDWTTSTSFPLYAETARLQAAQQAAAGPVVEGALSFRFARRFGVAAAFGWSRRDGSAAVDAQLPHPLYLDRPRAVSGSASGLEYRQLASHLDLEWRPLLGKLELAIFAGPSLLDVEAQIVESVTASEAYPYDSASFASASASAAKSAESVGWNAGAAVSGKVASHLELGLQARYSRATPGLTTSGGSVTLTAGGFDVAAFLRLGF